MSQSVKPFGLVFSLQFPNKHQEQEREVELRTPSKSLLQQKHPERRRSVIFGEVSQRPISEIFRSGEEKMPTVSRERPIWENKENSGKSRANQNLQNGFSEQEESSPKIEEDWIKIGDEYFQNPASITLNATLKQVLKEFAIPDPIPNQFDQNLNEMHKRKRSCFEDENQEEAAQNMSYAFIKNRRSTNSEEKYVKLHVINERFMSKIVDLEQEKDKVYTFPCGFSTKRRYLYD